MHIISVRGQRVFAAFLVSLSNLDRMIALLLLLSPVRIFQLNCIFWTRPRSTTLKFACSLQVVVDRITLSTTSSIRAQPVCTCPSEAYKTIVRGKGACPRILSRFTSASPHGQCITPPWYDLLLFDGIHGGCFCGEAVQGLFKSPRAERMPVQHAAGREMMGGPPLAAILSMMLILAKN